jgi:hypothetical protein
MLFKITSFTKGLFVGLDSIRNDKYNKKIIIATTRDSDLFQIEN